MKKLLLQILLTFFTSALALATHQRAGEITYRWISGLTYEITLITYTFTPSPADRPELEVFWGDGSSSILPRTEIIDMPNDIRKNTYIGVHSYAAAGIFKISMEDPNRNYGILNIPNSVNVPMYLETLLIINPFIGPNSSPVLLNPPIDNGCVNEIFIHNPGAYDPDGDSLSYKLTVCKGADGLNVPGYTLPLASNSISIDPYSGDLIWDSPVLQGEYNLAILIQEWRKGVLIGTVLRDLQVQIVSCNNQPPKIQDIQDTCVEAGSILNLNITATDPNNDVVTLTASGGPLLQTISPAQFQQPAVGTGTVSASFSWQTTCEHVRKQAWQMYFKATDNGTPVNLVDIKTLNITVVAPAPKNLNAQPAGNSITLTWDISQCSNAIGYRIYRRNGYFGFIPSYCETGVPAYTGYAKIADVNNIGTTSFTDNNNGQGLLQGIDYCYMIIAYFADEAESYASLEVCTSLIHDTPIITNVSVSNTDIIDGSTYIAWSKPTQHDTVLCPGPYKYNIFRSESFWGTNFLLIDSLTGINDTIITDSLINTKEKAYSYRIDLINNTPGNVFWMGSSQVASSVYLSISPADNKLNLTWAANTPWTNYRYDIYKLNNTTLLFDSIGTTQNNNYTDIGLLNGATYCYKIKTIGEYSAPGLIKPIINWSQIECGVPVDMEPPCPPTVKINIDCDQILNIISWQLPDDTCMLDVAYYEIFFTPVKNGEPFLIYSSSDATSHSFVHQGLNTIAGCYSVYAIDSFGNRSPLVEPVCLDIDSCTLYTLPNVFTPDGDGINDFFIPFPYKFVDKIEIKIFNRWGQIVFKTDNPDINWDGKNIYTRQRSTDGVYYYICDVYEYRLNGLAKRTLKGFFHIINSK